MRLVSGHSVGSSKGSLKMMFWILMILLIESGLLQVLRFDQCHSGWIQVVEGTTNVILLTCTTSNPSDRIIWSVDSIDQPPNKLELSICYSFLKCGISSFPEYNLTRPGNNYSNLELLIPANRSFLNRIRFICSRGSGSDVVCNVDLIYPAVVSSCNIQVVRGEIKWRVNGSCIITKVFSSRELYACFLMQRQNNLVDVNVANGTYNPTFSAPDPLYGSGVCSYTTEFPLVSASYVYSVTVVPGNNSTSAGIITVERAETPTSTCETSNIPENSTVICTCQTLSVGKPGGRLLWLFSRTNGVNTVIATGNTGVANLTMESQRLTRQDSGLVFQCVVDWVTNFTGLQHVTNVTYPPSAVIISKQISNTFPYLEGDTVNLVCDVQSSPGNPAAELTWSGYRGNPVVSKSIPTTLQLMLQREDNNRNITCKATNKYTENKGLDIQTFTILEVYYRPVIVLKHGKDNSCKESSDSWKCTVTEGQQVDVECTADSNPPPTNISWRLASKSDLPIGSGSRLNIRSANFTADSGVYICSVTTEKMNASDIRLPLSSERYFIVTIIESQNREGESLGAGAIVGVTIAVYTLIVAVTGIVLFVWARRRGWILPCADMEASRISHQATPVQLSPSEEQNRGIYDNESSTEDIQVKCRNNYAMLKVEEIGLTSTYSDLKQYENISGATNPT